MRVHLAIGMLLVSGVTFGQTPQPFPKPGSQPAKPPAPASPATTPAPERAVAPKPGPPPAGAAQPAVTEAMIGAPLYPNAVYLTSYDAGRGQRFYLFGVSNAFADMVAYYKTVLKQNGEKLFDSPPTHQFETGRFREDSMAFPPSVTIKDYTFGGSPGYPNARAGGQPSHFPTILQYVGPPEAGAK